MYDYRKYKVDIDTPYTIIQYLSCLMHEISCHKLYVC